MTCRHKNQRWLPEREWLPWWWCLTERWRQSSPLTAQRWRPAASRATVTCSQHYTSRCINTGVVISTLFITLRQYRCGHFHTMHHMLHQYRCGHFHTTHHAASIQVWSFPLYASCCINTGVVISALNVTLHQHRYGHFCTMHQCINTGMFISALCITLHQYRYGHFCTKCHAASIQVNKWKVHMCQYPCAR